MYTGLLLVIYILRHIFLLDTIRCFPEINLKFLTENFSVLLLVVSENGKMQFILTHPVEAKKPKMNKS